MVFFGPQAICRRMEHPPKVTARPLSDPSCFLTMRNLRIAALIAGFCVCTSAFAAEQRPLTPEQILAKIKYPSEFEATVFASPPDISYPIFISAAPDGTLFVGCDQNGSIDRK